MSRKQVASSIGVICEILLDKQQVQSDRQMHQKLKAAKNYADTLLSAQDCARLAEALGNNAALLQALGARDLDSACEVLRAGGSSSEQLLYALSCAQQLRPDMQEEEMSEIWSEVEVLCELARSKNKCL